MAASLYSTGASAIPCTAARFDPKPPTYRFFTWLCAVRSASLTPTRRPPHLKPWAPLRRAPVSERDGEGDSDETPELKTPANP